MSETEKFLARLREARDRRLAKLSTQQDATVSGSEESVTLTKGQLEALLNETVSATLQKVQTVQTLQKRYQDEHDLQKTGDPEVDQYIEDVKADALSGRTDLMRSTVVEKLRKSSVLNWNKADDYSAVRPGQHITQGKEESLESFKSRGTSLPVAGTRENVTEMIGGGAGSETKAKREAERQA